MIQYCSHRSTGRFTCSACLSVSELIYYPVIILIVCFMVSVLSFVCVCVCIERTQDTAIQ